MRYDPGIQNRSGELLAAGITEAGRGVSQGIGAGIEEYGKRRDELKGYRQVALALGLPPDQVDKMSLGEIKGHIMANEIKTQQTMLAQKKQAQAAIAPFIQAIQKNLKGGGPDMDALMSGQGPRAAKPASPLDAVLGAAANNPLALNTDIGTTALQEALKKGLTTPKTPQVVDVDGIKMVGDETTGRWRPVPTPKPVRTPAGAPPIKSPDGKLYWDYNAMTWKPISGGGDPFSDPRFTGGGTGGGGSTPQPAMRFKKDPDTGAIVQY